jgi:long-subunit fatty acid transport protein
VSPRSIGRGGTNIACSDNGGVLLDNPAAAVNVEGTTLIDIGVDLMLCDFHFANARNSSAGDDSLFPLPQVSIIRKSADGQWAYGLGVFSPAGFGQAFDLEGPPPFSGQYHYKSFGTLGQILPSVAYRATDRLSIGATLGVAYTHDEVEGPYFLQSPGPFQRLPTVMDIQATGAALTWSVGLQYELSDATTLGLTYRSDSRFQAHGPTRAFVPGMGWTGYDTQLDITWPQSVGAGIKHELCRHRFLMADVVWFNWARAFDDLGIHLTNPTTPGFPELYEQFPLHWRDTVSVRLGYEQRFDNGRVFRCGYVHHRSPVPDATLTPFIQATLEHGVSMGYGWQWRSWEIDLSYMFSFGTDRTVATSGILGGDFDDAFHRAQTHAIAFSFLRSY